MDATAELGRNPVSISTRFSLSMNMCRLTLDEIVEPVSRDQILRRERGTGNIHFPCSADHVQDWQPYPLDPYSCYMFDHTDVVANIWTHHVDGLPASYNPPTPLVNVHIILTVLEHGNRSRPRVFSVEQTVKTSDCSKKNLSASQHLTKYGF